MKFWLCKSVHEKSGSSISFGISCFFRFILKTLMTDIGIEGKDLYNKNGFLSEFEIGPIQFRTQFQAI